MNVPQKAREHADWLASRLRWLVADRDGATAIEYALIAGLISLVIVGGVTYLGSQISTEWLFVANTIDPKLTQ